MQVYLWSLPVSAACAIDNNKQCSAASTANNVWLSSTASDLEEVPASGEFRSVISEQRDGYTNDVNMRARQATDKVKLGLV